MHGTSVQGLQSWEDEEEPPGRLLQTRPVSRPPFRTRGTRRRRPSEAPSTTRQSSSPSRRVFSCPEPLPLGTQVCSWDNRSVGVTRPRRRTRTSSPSNFVNLLYGPLLSPYIVKSRVHRVRGYTEYNIYLVITRSQNFSSRFSDK